MFWLLKLFLVVRTIVGCEEIFVKIILVYNTSIACLLFALLAISMDFYFAGLTYYMCNHDDFDSDSDASSVDSKPLPQHPDDWSDEDEVIVVAGGEKIQDWAAQL